jgi:hypothetical protein
VILMAIWQRWLLLGWIGRISSLAAALYAFGWVLGNLGLNEMARELGAVALYIAAFPITALIIRGLWRHSTAHHRR